MYTNTGYFDLTDSQLEDKTVSLRINCCGVYRLISQPSMYTIRPGGRPDYQLLYIASGRTLFMKDGANDGSSYFEVAAGNMILYRPHEYQQYIYYLEDKPEVYWVHFTGNEVERLLAETCFSLNGTFDENRILYTGISSGYQQLFLSMIREVQLPRPCCEELSALYFKELLCLIRRQRTEGANKPQIQKDMEHAAHFFHENFTKEIVIDEYARALHMSTCWFIRSFKRYVGMPPGQYLTSIRISKAKELLESTGYTVSEIGGIVGYENPLYFSRIFKKQTGLSPVDYRKALH